MKKSKSAQRFDQLLQAMVTQPVPEDLQKKLEHQRRLTAQVMAILELAKVNGRRHICQ
jgi:hypothetical protein